MPVKAEWIRYGDFDGYLALPERAATPLPAVVVIQEVFGVESHIEDVTRRIAAAGYVALAPDLYADGGKRPEHFSKERIAEAVAFMYRVPPAARLDPAQRQAELAKLPEAERMRVTETYSKLFSFAEPGKMEGFLAHLREAVRHLRRERAETAGQKVACVGFCMGGGLSALLSCEEPEVSAAAVFYGTAPPAEKVGATRSPVIAFYGANDARVNATVPAFEEAMRAAGRPFEKRVYEGAGHAFFNDTSPAYEVRAARDAFARLLSFFAATIAE